MKVDAPSNEKLTGIWPSIRNGSNGTVAFSDTINPSGPEDSVASVAGMMFFRYLMNGKLPAGTFDTDKSIDTRAEEFRAVEKG